MPNHATHNQAPNHNRRACLGCLGCFGAVTAAGSLLLINFFGGCDNSKGSDSYHPGVYPSATAEPTPGISSPDETPRTPKPTKTRTTNPETTQPAPQQSSPKPEQETPSDSMANLRRQVANRYAGCALVSFTRTGSNELTLDLSLQSDVNSIDARSEGKSDTLSWNDPRIILTKISDEGKPVKPAFFNAEISGDPDHPNNPKVFPPSDPKDGMTMGVWIETNAATNNHGEEHYAVADRYCGAFSFDKDNGWRPPAEAPEVQELYYNDRQISGGGS